MRGSSIPAGIFGNEEPFVSLVKQISNAGATDILADADRDGDTADLIMSVMAANFSSFNGMPDVFSYNLGPGDIGFGQ
ncbi:MAG: hypothetical protein WDM70_10620 [Nitrosomonadales bacterium]